MSDDDWLLGLPPVQVFGVWDAPMTDDSVEIPVPRGVACMYCRETFEPDDNGAIMPTGFAQHRECGLRGVIGGIGHLVNHSRYCGGELGPDAGLGFRQSALLVWRHHVDGARVAEGELDALVKGE